MPGPVPKRSDQKHGHRTRAELGEVTHAPAGEQVRPPEPDEDWHPIARDFFMSLRKSGQSAFYQASDWQVARYVAEAMSRNLSDGKFSAMLFASVTSAMSELLVTEGDRRRVKLELERHAHTDPDEDASVTALAAYRRDVGA